VEVSPAQSLLNPLKGDFARTTFLNQDSQDFRICRIFVMCNLDNL
jgi:hypothetical protein